MPKKEAFNYYASELDKLSLDSEYPMTVKIFDGEGNQTKTISLNADSIREIQKLFKKVLKKQSQNETKES